jgi:UDP-N-acetylmuramoyl-L-alanyl-D-glutamate--2,6-diaminopimelate ligase
MRNIFSSEHTLKKRIQVVSRKLFYSITDATNTTRLIPKIITLCFLNPTRRLKLIGVTGTNGKTTTTYLIHQALQILGVRAGLIGTVKALIGNDEYETGFTTPKPVSLNRLFLKMLRKDCKYCVMEVSSIGLEELRVSGLHFEAALFTNLTLDHLEYHKTFENYANAKSKLFTSLNESSPVIANRDDNNYRKVTGNRESNTFTFGKAPANESDTATSINFEIVENSIDGLTINIEGQIEKYLLVGEFNAYNIAAAYSTLSALGFPKNSIIEALSVTTAPPGRLKLVNPDYNENNDPIVIIDFAHTPDAIENLLKTVKTVTSDEHKIITVFGCSGGRGEEKRPLMAAIAEKFSDFIIVTTRHPRNEDVNKIVSDITAGFTGNNSYTVELNRKKAIQKAIGLADSKSVVVLAGMGHYNYQEVKGVKTPHSDEQCALEALKCKRVDNISE